MTETGQRSRRESRERAIELGYEAEVRHWSIDELLASLAVAPDDFAIGLLRSAEQHRDRADELISAASTRWSLSRMPLLDVVVMRQAVAELLDGDTPTGVVLSQAVELAGRYSTDGSGRFVNGILATIAKDLDAKTEDNTDPVA
ncbi:MAG: transcription antitermination factor NusB [Actinomycetota bacterium]